MCVRDKNHFFVCSDGLRTAESSPGGANHISPAPGPPARPVLACWGGAVQRWEKSGKRIKSRRDDPALTQQPRMGRKLLLILFTLCLAVPESVAVPKPHQIVFGKWTAAKSPNATGEKMLDLKVRPLLVDSRLREYTTGAPHELTDRLFVVRRVFRVNDALPQESAPRWQWQRGGWLLVDRLSGRISPLSLPEFDPFYSTASWYRDYVAYCGVSDGQKEDGQKRFAVVAQVGRRKPILKKALSEPAGNDEPDAECPAPTWERTPPRVTFQPAGSQKVTFSIRGRVVDAVTDAEEEAEE
jgi:hypothetical protein